MLIILFDIILFIFRIIFNLLKFIIKITIGILAFILTKSFLRFPFLLFTIGFLLHINFNTLATILEPCTCTTSLAILFANLHPFIKSLFSFK